VDSLAFLLSRLQFAFTVSFHISPVILNRVEPYMIPFSITVQQTGCTAREPAFLFRGAGIVVFPLMLFYTAMSYSVLRSQVQPGANSYH
jgi:cytochrome bd-type quinol oxidase subunit 2